MRRPPTGGAVYAPTPRRVHRSGGGYRRDMRSPYADPPAPRFAGARLLRRRTVRAPGRHTVAALALALGLLVAPAASAQAPPAPKPPHVLQTGTDDYLTHLGPVRVNTRTSRLSGAYRAFGRPSSASGKANVRRVRWKAAGVSILGVTFGGCRRKTCRTSELLIQSARVTGPRWQTEAGLRVGDPAARIAELYPEKTAPSDGSGDVVLQDAFSQIGEPGDIPIVTALVRGNVVAGFDVWVGNAGD